MKFGQMEIIERMGGDVDGYLCVVFFNPHRHYAFLRKHEDELMLIVANFDEHDTQVAVNIPSHAFDYFKIPTLDNAVGTELLTGDTVQLVLSPDIPATLHVPGYSGAIVKIKL